MAAALVLAAGLRVARGAVALVGPRGAQVRSGRGGAEGVPRALPPSGAGVLPQARAAHWPRGDGARASGRECRLSWRLKLQGRLARSGW